MQLETFPSLAQLDFVTHAFTLRTDADTKSDDFELHVLQVFGATAFASAEQTHGDSVAIVHAPASRIPAVDALVTRQRNLALVIRCADCAAVFVVDRATPAIALIHSGKKGTRANIVGNTLSTMHGQLGAAPRDCLAFISPSIGPCHYEMDIWTGIEQQLRGAGVTDVHNPRVCTACHLDRYFSYRAEKGNTGRMFALLSLR
ncbi:MAG TPA: polyphenol oxidase family protein [Verrucomicrobiae bacterium]|nr:polyphenol oxidase family protein [Verrucomicrobiae bacterium]